MIVKLMVDGGEMKPGPAVGQQLGPLGINIGEVIKTVNEATSGFKGMKVPVILDINGKTKKFKIEISSPPTSELIKKELILEKGSGDHKKQKIADASIEQIIKIAKIKYSNMLAKDFKSAVKSVVGSCGSLGVLVENKEAKELEKDIASGVFDKEIKEKKTETSDEKKAVLKAFFDKLIKEQEAAKKAEEEAKAAKEAEQGKTAETEEKTATAEKTDGKSEKSAKTAEPAKEKSAEKKQSNVYK